MVEPTHPTLSVRTQCRLIDLPRSTFLYEPVPIDKETLQIMHTLDKLALEHPYWGSRNATLELRAQGICINRKRVQRLRREMGVESLAPKPRTSTPNQAHATYPYLLRHLTVNRSNQVWAADITYIPLRDGFAYCVAIIDWYSRKVLAWRLSNTMEAAFCVDALNDALRRHGTPEIFNTDQGAQFTGDEFIDVLKHNNIRISMDGKGRCLDNVFVERLWRSLKYENVYLHCYATLPEAKAGIAAYVAFFNQRRRHQGLGNDTPDAVYARQLSQPVTNDQLKTAA